MASAVMKRRRRHTTKTKNDDAEIAPKHAATHSLLTLPGEIKNKIYEYCIDDEITVEIATKKPISSISAWPQNWRITTFEGHPEQKEGDARELSLFKVCNQIRYETLSILASIGHTCLHVDTPGSFRAELMAPLPTTYVANIREIRLWKFVPCLKGQTLTKALPGLQSIILDFTTQNLAEFVGGHSRVVWGGPWRRAWFATQDFQGRMKSFMAPRFQRECGFLAKSDPDRHITLRIRVPFGRFASAAYRNRQLRGTARTDISADYTIAVEASEAGDGQCHISMKESPGFAHLEECAAHGDYFYWNGHCFDILNCSEAVLAAARA